MAWLAPAPTQPTTYRRVPLRGIAIDTLRYLTPYRPPLGGPVSPDYTRRIESGPLRRQCHGNAQHSLKHIGTVILPFRQPLPLRSQCAKKQLDIQPLRTAPQRPRLVPKPEDVSPGAGIPGKPTVPSRGSGAINVKPASQS